MYIRAGYDISFAADAPTPLVALLSVHPSRNRDLRTPHRITVSGGTPAYDFADPFGNIGTRVTAPAGEVTLSCDFVIEDSGEVDRRPPSAPQIPVDLLPCEVLPFLLGSRYCDTQHLNDVAWANFGHLRTARDRVEAIVAYAHERITFGYQFARATRTASEGHYERVGVCRDYAHLAVTLCRCMNIPARYCTGYLGDIAVPPVDAPMDFSAWFDVYIDGGWYAYDARHGVPRVGRILMARGRDATDVALTTAFGAAWLTRFDVHTDEASGEDVRAFAQPSLRLAA